MNLNKTKGTKPLAPILVLTGFHADAVAETSHPVPDSPKWLTDHSGGGPGKGKHHCFDCTVLPTTALQLTSPKIGLPARQGSTTVTVIGKTLQTERQGFSCVPVHPVGGDPRIEV